MRIAAIDQGSSSTKGALFDAAGRVVARATVPVAVRRHGAGAEHDPEELVASVRQALAELSVDGRPDGLALACQRSTCLLWERDGGRPLSAAISWQDRSAASRIAALAPLRGEVARRTGLRLTPYYAGGKLGLLLERTPGAAARAAGGEVVAGTLDAFLVHRLTGRPATEPGHAGRTLLYDLEAGAWDPWLCDRFAVPPAALPELRTSVGRWGEVAGVPLLAVAGDQQAALVGNGGEETGVAVAHFGTGAFVLCGVGERPRRHQGLLSAVTWSRGASRHFQLEGSVNSAGSAVEWAARLAGVAPAALPEAVPEGELDPAALPWCLPGFVGVAAPWWQPTPGAVLGGVRLEHDASALLRGVLAGVVLRVVDCLAALGEAGRPAARVRASGRLLRLPALPRLLADASGLPVEVMSEEEAGLRGAARLAALELGCAAWPTPAGAPLEPAWSELRRQRVRAYWHAFATAATGVLPPENGPANV